MVVVTDVPGNDLGARLAGLEQRVERLEQGQAAAEDPTTGAEGTGGRFWALDGLRARLPGGTGAVVFAGLVPLPGEEEYAWQYGRPTDDVLASDWAELGEAIAALGHPVRLRILQLVLTGTRSVAELAVDDRLGTSGQLYHHARQLMAAGWLRQTARGRYGVPPDRVVPLLVLLTTVEQ
jgi:hypothetical protein